MESGSPAQVRRRLQKSGVNFGWRSFQNEKSSRHEHRCLACFGCFQNYCQCQLQSLLYLPFQSLTIPLYLCGTNHHASNAPAFDPEVSRRPNSFQVSPLNPRLLTYTGISHVLKSNFIETTRRCFPFALLPTPITVFLSPGCQRPTFLSDNIW